MDTSFVDWVNNSLKLWLRGVLIDNLDYDNVSQLEKAVDLCVKEASGELNSLNWSYFGSDAENKISFTIDKITAVKDVMGLCDGVSIDLDKRLTIIYGPNGAGKSSYARLLKKVANPSISVLPNVFSSSPGKTCFRIDYSMNEKQYVFSYPEDQEKQLSVDVYDEDDSLRFVKGDNDFSFEPEELLILRYLSSFSDKVKSKLEEKRDSLSDSFQIIPDDYMETDAGRLYFDYEKNGIELGDSNLMVMTEQDKGELQQLELSLQKELQEQRLAGINSELTNLSVLRGCVSFLSDLFSDKAKKELLLKHDVVLRAKRSASEYAESVFSNSSLGNIGEDTWKAMWMAAERYSKQVYPEYEFPYLGDSAVCVLCHQPLENDKVKKRMISFKEYVRSDLEQEFKARLSEWKKQPCFTTKINLGLIKLALSSINTEKSGIQSGEIVQEINDFSLWQESAVLCPDDIQVYFCDERKLQRQLSSIVERINEVEKEKTIIEQNKNQNQITLIKTRIRELKAKEWVCSQIEVIRHHAEVLKKRNLLSKAISLTSTNGLTIKAKEVSKRLLDETYVTSFNEAIHSLGADNLKVVLVAGKAQKGRGAYKLILKDSRHDSIIDVLSSGERRIVSLAAFIADSKCGRGNVPFVFDDPVSSLDNEFENHVAKALCELANNRQVIVFSHRLSLISELHSLSKKNSFKFSALAKEDGVGAGLVDDDPTIVCSNIKTSANSILNKIQKDYAEIKKNPSSASLYTNNKNIYCQKFRNLVEQSIEVVLFFGIVKRFDKNISTKKIKWASQISEDDCKFIDDYMSEYSMFDHSQSDEKPQSDISFEKLISDYNCLVKFCEEIKKRQEKYDR